VAPCFWFDAPPRSSSPFDLHSRPPHGSRSPFSTSLLPQIPPSPPSLILSPAPTSRTSPSLSSAASNDTPPPLPKSPFDDSPKDQDTYSREKEAVKLPLLFPAYLIDRRHRPRHCRGATVGSHVCRVGGRGTANFPNHHGVDVGPTQARRSRDSRISASTYVPSRACPIPLKQRGDVQ